MGEAAARRRSRRRRPRRLAADVCDALLRRYVAPSQIELIKLQVAWPQVAPSNLVQHGWPARLRDGELLLHVRDNQWLHELRYLQQDLLARLQWAVPTAELKTIRTRVGAVAELPPAYEREERPPRPGLPAQPADETIAALEEISDPALKQAAANARVALSRL